VRDFAEFVAASGIESDGRPAIGTDRFAPRLLPTIIERY
jgi:hypothetical protein